MARQNQELQQKLAKLQKVFPFLAFIETRVFSCLYLKNKRSPPTPLTFATATAFVLSQPILCSANDPQLLPQKIVSRSRLSSPFCGQLATRQPQKCATFRRNDLKKNQRPV